MKCKNKAEIDGFCRLHYPNFTSNMPNPSFYKVTHLLNLVIKGYMTLLRKMLILFNCCLNWASSRIQKPNVTFVQIEV